MSPTSLRRALSDNLRRRLRLRGPGSAFTAADFLDLGSRAAVDQALSRASRDGLIRRAARGIYELPTHDRVLGEVPVPAEAIARTIATRNSARIQIAGGAAAHALGLTDQVPIRLVYLTDGANRRVSLGKGAIIFKRTTPRQMATAGRISGTVIQALRHLGQRNVDDSVVSTLRGRLSVKDRKRLVQDSHLAPAWIADVMLRVGQR